MDLNQRPMDYDSTVLPTELFRQYLDFNHVSQNF